MIESVIEIKGGRIRNGEAFREEFKHLRDGNYKITVKDIRTRSLPQNAYYWGVVVPMVKKGLYDEGFDEVKTNEDAHEVLKLLHLKKQFVSKSTGDVIEFGGSTAELNVPGFNDYIERICRWAAEYLGIAIPSPNEQYGDFQEWEKQTVDQCD
jgi:hypothetical protein